MEARCEVWGSARCASVLPFKSGCERDRGCSDCLPQGASRRRCGVLLCEARVGVRESERLPPDACGGGRHAAASQPFTVKSACECVRVSVVAASRERDREAGGAAHQHRHRDQRLLVVRRGGRRAARLVWGGGKGAFGGPLDAF
eukprot:6181224-Pleurochrysis_carterae.AAC.2